MQRIILQGIYQPLYNIFFPTTLLSRFDINVMQYDVVNGNVLIGWITHARF